MMGYGRWEAHELYSDISFMPIRQPFAYKISQAETKNPCIFGHFILSFTCILIKNIISFLTISYFIHHMIHKCELSTSGTDLNCTANPIIYNTALSFLHHIISV